MIVINDAEDKYKIVVFLMNQFLNSRYFKFQSKVVQQNDMFPETTMLK